MPEGYLFRMDPPRELVESILTACAFSAGFSERRWFTKDQLTVSTSDEWLPLLEPYYYPCKARRFLGSFTAARCITVLRHILRCHNYTLTACERVVGGRKTTMYQIQPMFGRTDLTDADLHVDFS